MNTARNAGRVFARKPEVWVLLIRESEVFNIHPLLTPQSVASLADKTDTMDTTDKGDTLF